MGDSEVGEGVVEAEVGEGWVERSGTVECEKVQRIQTDAWAVVAAAVVVVVGEVEEASD